MTMWVKARCKCGQTHCLNVPDVPEPKVTPRGNRRSIRSAEPTPYVDSRVTTAKL